MADKKLVFEASAYRDWTLFYCQLAHEMFVSEFRKQYDWGITDICFVWDGNTTAMYRAPEEHLLGLFHFVEQELKKDKDFLTTISEEIFTETRAAEEYFEKMGQADFASASWPELLNHSRELATTIVRVMPKMLIAIYLPQAADLFPDKKESLRKDIESLVFVRSKTDHIVGPMGNRLCEAIGSAVLTKIGLDSSLGRFISRNEIESIASSEGSISSEVRSKLEKDLVQRSKYFLAAGGEVWQAPLANYLSERGWVLKDEEASPLKGTVAYKADGLVRGTARIVLNKTQLHKVEEGDIVVAPMTTPEYSPILSRVTAIVTDEGGITCHAAIVAREMKIPTIIGTRTATKTVKDGDSLELDTNSGNVKVSHGK